MNQQRHEALLQRVGHRAADGPTAITAAAATSIDGVGTHRLIERLERETQRPQMVERQPTWQKHKNAHGVQSKPTYSANPTLSHAFAGTFQESKIS